MHQPLQVTVQVQQIPTTVRYSKRSMHSFFAPISRDSPSYASWTADAVNNDETTASRTAESQSTAGTASAAPKGRHPNYKAKDNDPHCVVLMLLEPSEHLIRLNLTTHTNTSGLTNAAPARGYASNPQDHREIIHTTILQLNAELAAALASPAEGNNNNNNHQGQQGQQERQAQHQDPQERQAQQLAQLLAGDLDYGKFQEQLAQRFNERDSEKTTWAYQTLNRVRRSDEVACDTFGLQQRDIFWRPLLVISGFQNQHEARAFNAWGKDPKMKTLGRRQGENNPPEGEAGQAGAAPPAAIYFGHPRTHKRVKRDTHPETQDLLPLPKKYPFRAAPAVHQGVHNLEAELERLRDYRGELLHPSIRRMVGTFWSPWNTVTRNNPTPRETHTIPLTAFWYRPEFAPNRIDYKPHNVTYAALALPAVTYLQGREEQLAQQQEEEEQLAQQAAPANQLNWEQSPEEHIPEVQLAQQLYNSTEHFLRPETPPTNNNYNKRRNTTNSFSL